MSFTHGRAKTGGRKRGARNKKTVAPKTLSRRARPSGGGDSVEGRGDHARPESARRDQGSLLQYQHPEADAVTERASSRLISGPPKTAQEARDAIARITSMIARAEIDESDHGARVIAGLEAFLNARAHRRA